MDTKVRTLCLLVMLMTSKAYGQAVSQKDSLNQWLGKFSEVRLQEMSSDGRWIVMNKTLAFKNDTVIIFNTDHELAPLILPGRINVGFLRGDHVLTYNNDRADLRHLKRGVLQSYVRIRQYDILKKTREYVLYDHSNQLRLYQYDGTKLSQLDHVKRYITDQSNHIFAEQNDTASSDVFKISKDKTFKLYSTSHIIERMELSEFKNYLIIYEKDRLSQLRRMVVIDSKRETVYYPLGPSFIQQDFSTFKEIRNDHAALLKVVRFERTSTGYVDLYYGKDKDLKSKMDGKKAVEEYWLWNVKTNTIQKFDLGQNRSVTDIGNGTQFLHYDGNELRDYTRHRPLLNVSLYNSKTKSNYPIGIIQPQIVASGNGRYLLYQLEDAKWEMLNTSDNKRTLIEDNDLHNPVFTENDQSIYFESGTGLWEYSLNSSLLTQLNSSRGKKVRILNTDRSFLSQGSSIYHSTIDSDTPLIIESLDSISQTVSYYSLKGHKILQDFLITKNKVSKFLHSDRLDRWCWLEENYNLAPMLKASAKHASAQMLYNENQNDRSAKEIRQEMIDYRLTNGKALKGLLYYPQHFNPSTQYPMIVHIYQIQHTKSKEYLIPKFDGLGFNIRLLLEQGYFVFLPDLLTDRRGPGIAGLECINAALDALADHQNIDHSKIGLTGHSFGGYLTNLISTQSNRFAAYISGSGVSDIIQSYYSLNRNFPGPHYWQLESGQYQMASSLADNKQLYFNNNPIYDAEKLSAPILLWTGKTDENVVPENTMGFYLALKRYRKDVIALFYHKSGHSLTDEPERLDLNKKALEWWAYFLKDQKEVPWINQQMKKDAH